MLSLQDVQKQSGPDWGPWSSLAIPELDFKSTPSCLCSRHYCVSGWLLPKEVLGDLILK